MTISSLPLVGRRAKQYTHLFGPEWPNRRGKEGRRLGRRREKEIGREEGEGEEEKRKVGGQAGRVRGKKETDNLGGFFFFKHGWMHVWVDVHVVAPKI